MNYLSIDTSSTICSVTFSYKSKELIIEKENVREHSKYLANISKELIKDKIKDIDFIALSIGPGSYSGLKIGCSFAKGLSYAINKPIIPVETFIGMNKNIKNDNKYYISLYSHRDYAFFQLFESGKSINKFQCDKISNMKNYSVYGYGLDNKLSNNKYIEIKPSSLAIGKIALVHYSRLFENNLDNISPIYLSKKD